MKKTNFLIALTSLLILATLFIPAVLVLPFKDDRIGGKLAEKASQTPTKAPSPKANADSGVEVAVYRFSKARIEKIPLEDYLIGVVASEMPAEFGEEALKAQALTARTYIVKQMLSKESPLGLPKGAQVGDTQLNQVYKSKQELQNIWGMDYSWRIKKIMAAVRATSGQILTYNGRPITATFFSTSNGYTENSEDYWSSSLPYLRSVASPWDQNSPMFSRQTVMSVTEFETKLGVHLGNGPTIGTIMKRTAGKRVGKVNFNGKILTGKEIREKLGLNSSDFSLVRRGSSIIMKTKGYGHGVGMSQYGANGMAAEGKTYQDIVKHYYQGVEIASAANMLATITARK